VSEWKPIETAPKNDQWILIRGRNSANKPMIPIVAAWHPPGVMTRHGWVESLGFRDVNEYAIEWTELPEE
jgi:hypothetical protein